MRLIGYFVPFQEEIGLALSSLADQDSTTRPLTPKVRLDETLINIPNTGCSLDAPSSKSCDLVSAKVSSDLKNEINDKSNLICQSNKQFSSLEESEKLQDIVIGGKESCDSGKNGLIGQLCNGSIKSNHNEKISTSLKDAPQFFTVGVKSNQEKIEVKLQETITDDLSAYDKLGNGKPSQEQRTTCEQPKTTNDNDDTNNQSKATGDFRKNSTSSAEVSYSVLENNNFNENNTTECNKGHVQGSHGNSKTPNNRSAENGSCHVIGCESKGQSSGSKLPSLPTSPRLPNGNIKNKVRILFSYFMHCYCNITLYCIFFSLT